MHAWTWLCRTLLWNPHLRLVWHFKVLKKSNRMTEIDLPWNSEWTCGRLFHRSSLFYTNRWNSLQLWAPRKHNTHSRLRSRAKSNFPSQPKCSFCRRKRVNEHRNCSPTSSSFPLYVTGSRGMAEVGFQLTGETARKHDTTFTQMKVVTSLRPCLTSWERHYKVCSTAAGGTSEASVCAQLCF